MYSRFSVSFDYSISKPFILLDVFVAKTRYFPVPKSVLVLAAVTVYHNLGGLKHWNLFSHIQEFYSKKMRNHYQ